VRTALLLLHDGDDDNIEDDDQDDHVHDYHDAYIWRCCLAFNGQTIHVNGIE
jgi:hypothetical protein